MAEVTIKARANGPYKVEGPVRVLDAEGNEFVLPEGSAIALCRCGHSQTKPFCDKSHRRVGFGRRVRRGARSPGLIPVSACCAGLRAGSIFRHPCPGQNDTTSRPTGVR